MYTADKLSRRETKLEYAKEPSNFCQVLIVHLEVSSVAICVQALRFVYT